MADLDNVWKEILFEVKSYIASSDEEVKLPDENTLFSILLLSTRKFLREAKLCRDERKRPIDCNQCEYPIDPICDFIEETCTLMYTGCSKDGWERLDKSAYYVRDCILTLRNPPQEDITPWGLTIEYAYVPALDDCTVPDCLRSSRWHEGVIQATLSHLYRMNAQWRNLGLSREADDMWRKIAVDACIESDKYGGYPLCNNEYDNRVQDFLGS